MPCTAALQAAPLCMMSLVGRLHRHCASVHPYEVHACSAVMEGAALCCLPGQEACLRSLARRYHRYSASQLGDAACNYIMPVCRAWLMLSHQVWRHCSAVAPNARPELLLPPSAEASSAMETLHVQSQGNLESSAARLARCLFTSILTCVACSSASEAVFKLAERPNLLQHAFSGTRCLFVQRLPSLQSRVLPFLVWHDLAWRCSLTHLGSMPECQVLLTKPIPAFLHRSWQHTAERHLSLRAGSIASW